MPNYVTLDVDDVDGVVNPVVTKRGNLSQYKKGLNEVESLTSAELAQYLTPSGNDAFTAGLPYVDLRSSSHWRNALYMGAESKRIP